MATILVADDEQLIRWSLSERLQADGLRVIEAATGQEAIDKVHEGVDLVLLDFKLPDIDGVTVLRQIKEHDPDVVVILLTAYATVDTAVEAMKTGAYHVANKPFNVDAVSDLVAKALETTQLRREVRSLRAEKAQPYAPERIVGDSPPMIQVKALLRQSGDEPGVDRAAHGRERHRQGSRRQGPALQQRPCAQAVREHHVFGDSGDAARERVVRP